MKKDAKAAETTTAPAIIVFGRDENDRAHASWFPLADAMLAERAAALMGMQVLRVTTDAHRAVAAELPAGRVFASGRGFVPFCAAGPFGRLSAFSEAFKPEPPAAPTEPLPKVANVPANWSDIGTNSLVLAADGESPGWFEAVVVETRSDILALRWANWPDLPPFVRRAEHVSLLSAAAHKAVTEGAGEAAA